MGSKIKEVRVQKGMTQEELAAKSGISRATICALEHGTERSVLSGTLVKLARAMGVSVDEIFFADDAQ